MAKLISKLITGAKAQPQTLQKIQESMRIKPGIAIELMVFEVTFGAKTCYCCWSGGELRDGRAYLTLVGQAALEALTNLPKGNGEELVLQELVPGAMPLREKIELVFEGVSTGTKICFVLDMQGELGSDLQEAFGVVSDRVSVAH